MITYRRPNDHLIRHASYLSLSNLDFLFFLLPNSYTSVWKGALTVYTGKVGEITKVGEFMMLFSEVPNMSEVAIPEPSQQKMVTYLIWIDLIRRLFGILYRHTQTGSGRFPRQITLNIFSQSGSRWLSRRAFDPFASPPLGQPLLTRILFYFVFPLTYSQPITNVTFQPTKAKLRTFKTIKTTVSFEDHFEIISKTIHFDEFIWPFVRFRRSNQFSPLLSPTLLCLSFTHHQVTEWRKRSRTGQT